MRSLLQGRPNGAPCIADAQCAIGYCSKSQGICCGGNGKACNAAADCCYGICVNNRCKCPGACNNPANYNPDYTCSGNCDWCTDWCETNMNPPAFLGFINKKTVEKCDWETDGCGCVGPIALNGDTRRCASMLRIIFHHLESCFSNKYVHHSAQQFIPGWNEMTLDPISDSSCDPIFNSTNNTDPCGMLCIKNFIAICKLQFAFKKHNIKLAYYLIYN